MEFKRDIGVSMNIGNIRPAGEPPEYFHKSNYYGFYTKVLGPLKEKKYPFFMTFCPFHNDKITPNLSVNIVSGTYNCFACQASGGYWNFVLKNTATGFDFILPEDLTDPEELARITQFEKTPKGPPDLLTLKTEESQAEAAHEFLFRSPFALRYLTRDRGLTEDTIRKWKLGFIQGAVCFPIPDKVRKFATLKLHKKYQTEGACNQLYPWDAVLYNKSPYVILVEGEPDMILTRQMGFNAVTQIQGAGTWDPEFTKHFLRKIVYLFHDNDTAGFSASVARAKDFMTAGISVFMPTWPSFMGNKEDHTDFFVKYRQTANNYQELLTNAPSALKYI